MSVEIIISVDQDTASAKLNELGRVTGDPATLLLSAAAEVQIFMKSYHEEFGEKWRGDHYMSGLKSGQFERSVSESWQEPVLLSEDTARVSNTNPILAHKITGGTISPVRASKLTIPLVPEAKGLSASEYQAATGTKLFAKGRVLARKGQDQEIVPIYALVDSVTQGPWPGAMPPQEEMQAVFDKAFEVRFSAVLAGGT